jgi:tRNA modification GTPase
MELNDTIAALATPFGCSGIGVIRLSGSKAREIMGKIFRPKGDITHFHSHTLYHGDVISPGTGRVLDEVLLCIMEKPHSYTGEDVVEINCHGGPLIIQTILKTLFLLGARPADPGEFTRRAFLNNRMDLAKAEAVLDLIQAKTEDGVRQSAGQLKGSLHQEWAHIREEIINIMAMVEAGIDFSDEDITDEETAGASLRLEHILEKITSLIGSYDYGKVMREGLRVLIMGKPNVGKSSLLNCLLDTDRAIVTPFPGTTRDFIEEGILIDGMPVTFTDTAGIRQTPDAIEEQGIIRVWEKLDEADLVLLMFDGSRELDGDDRLLMEKTRGKRSIFLINKSDLPLCLQSADFAVMKPPEEPLLISAKIKTGISSLLAKISQIVAADASLDRETVSLSRLRHVDILRRAAENLRRARENLRDDFSPEIVSVDLQDALSCLDELSGKGLPEEVLGQIFAQFCIGK